MLGTSLRGSREHRLAQGLGGRLEDRLGDVVVVRAVGDGDVQVHLRVGRQRLEELLDQLDRKVADRRAA